jgi:hypothetical protein
MAFVMTTEGKYLKMGYNACKYIKIIFNITLSYKIKLYIFKVFHFLLQVLYWSTGENIAIIISQGKNIKEEGKLKKDRPIIYVTEALTSEVSVGLKTLQKLPDPKWSFHV